MTWQKVIAPGESVGLELTATERKLVTECLYVMDQRYQDRVLQAPAGEPIPYTLDELEDLHGNLAFDANHTDDARRQKAFDKVLRKIERLLQTHTDQPQVVAPASSPATDDVPMIDGSADVPAEFRRIYLELVSLTDEFCNERLDTEYQELCREVAIALCSPGSPVVRGKRASWACGIVYTVGWVNFLGDPDTEPYVRAEEIAEWFGVSTATMYNKSKALREGLDLIPFDPRLTISSLLEENPLVWMLEVNGLLVDVRAAPRELQAAAYEQGLIPYIPADRDDTEGGYAVTHQRVGPSGKAKSSRKTKKSKRRSASAAYQIKITLDGTKPPVWRRLRVPDCTLEMLHEIIQVAMGWQNCHMHEFRAGDERFSMAAMAEFGEVDDEAREESDVLLSELVAAGHKRLRYWYDFGDDWWHTIKIEKTLDPQADEDYPVCTAGARACPPDDIGGIWGYVEFLEAMADPNHEQHDELKEWYGGDFDPERFAPDEVNQLLTP